MEQRPDASETSATPPDMARDPVCGMLVAIESAQHVADHEGVTYYFCGRGCRLEFEDDPSRFFAPDYVPSM